MLSRRLLAPLLIGALLLPIVILVLVGLARLFAAMGDERGATAVDYVALGVAVVWVVDLIALVLAQALHLLQAPDEPDEPQG